ncbi:MAG: dTDP-4-dehydrorhamnose reductase [Gammaproteobacteria bacterium]|nr:MAG: dTDP-4-dehydrorhamnose reductase [Gammaproteobacteria bacterium]
MKILLVGKNGQVGFELQRSLACLGNITATDRNTLDLTDDDSIRSVIQALKPNLIVNAAAYTAVDKAETEQDLAMQINANAPKVIAEQAKQLDIPFIHYSTDYVFNGQNDKPWTEQDQTDPISVYGHTKLLGEQAIIDSGVAHLIFRTSWVYGNRGNNFLLTMKRLATERDELSVVNDQIGAPTWSRHIADVTANIIAQAKATKDVTQFIQQHAGIYNLSGAGETSWHSFAKAIFELLEQQGEQVAKLNAIPTSAYPTPAQRPLYSCLDNQKLHQTFDIKLPDWQISLDLAF